MTRFAPRARAGLPCARSQRFLTRDSAEAFARLTDRGRVAEECPHCSGFHAVRMSAEAFARMQRQREAERLARVAAYTATVRREQ